MDLREFSKIMELADRELYRAKSDGRDRSYIISV